MVRMEKKGEIRREDVANWKKREKWACPIRKESKEEQGEKKEKGETGHADPCTRHPFS